MPNLRKWVLAGAIAAVAGVAGAQGTPDPGLGDGSSDVDKLMIVDCLLPGKVRRLGQGARYMSARRPIKTTAGDCEIRGGEYVAYDRASYATSLRVWLPQAEAGDPKAQTYVGEMFEEGLGTTPDYQAAVAWYAKAAEQGYSRAQMNLGSMYERGLGVPQDEAAALNWYRRASGLQDDELIYASEMEELETEVVTLREELAASEAEVQRLQQNLGTSRRQFDQSQSQLDQTRLELQELRYRAEQAPQLGFSSADVSALEREIQQKEQALVAAQDQVQVLRSELAQQQNDFAARLAAVEDGEQSYAAVLDLERERLRDLESEVSQLNASLADRQAQVRRSNDQITILQRQLEARTSADQAARVAALAELQEVIDEQRTQLTQNDRRIAELESSLQQQQAQLAAEQNDYQRLQSELAQDANVSDERREQLAEERARIADLQNQVATLRRELESKQSTIDSGRGQLAALEDQLAVARSDRAGSEESLSELRQLIERQQAELEQKALGAGYLEQELASQKTQLEQERQAFARRERALEEQIDLVEIEKQDLARRLEQTQQQLVEYEQQLERTERIVQTQESEILSNREQIANLRDDRDTLEREFTRVSALEDQVREQSVTLASVKGENSWLSAEKAKLEAEVAQLRRQAEGLNSAEAVVYRGPAPSLNQRSLQQVPNVNFGRYHALLIGNYNYYAMPGLATPANDVQAMADVLERKYGFRVQVLENATRKQILEALNDYRERLTEDDNFLLYYAGHGTLDQANDRGHWLPVDATLENPANWLSNVTITDYINTMTAKHIMVIADSCYAGTLTRTVRPNLRGDDSRKLPRDFLEKLSKTPSRTALTSGAVQPVMDGGGGSHSIFARNLLEVLRENNGVLQGPDLFLEVRQRVTASGTNVVGQEPAFDVIKNTGDLGAPFFFVASA